MIDVPKARAALLLAQGDRVVFSKAQAVLMFAEIERGQRALLALTNLRTVTNVAASAVGALA